MLKYAEVEAGRGTDILVAEKVMGFTFKGALGGAIVNAEGVILEDLPGYSVAVAAAWPVADKLGIFIGRFSKDNYCAFDSIRAFETGNAMHARTAPLAIVRMALKIKGA